MGGDDAVLPPAPPPARPPVGRARVNYLYEQYVHLPGLQAVWDSPRTPNPQLEPVFASAMHGVELGFLLLAEFLSDKRGYVAKRPRVERVAADVAAQCRLLTAVVDGELEEHEEEEEEEEEEEDGWSEKEQQQHEHQQPRPLSASSSAASSASCSRPLRSLTQPFPFPDAPPTITATADGGPSPGLARLTQAVKSAWAKVGAGGGGAGSGGGGGAGRHSLLKLVLNVSAALAPFGRWSVGVGLEPQVDALRAAVGLPPLMMTTGEEEDSEGSDESEGPARRGRRSHRRRLFLDYAALVRPEVVERTLTGHTYDNPEDYFFRAVHLGTECWAKVALERLEGARRLAGERRWHAASARCGQAAAVLDYLGDHVLLLTTMNLRDYLQLKVEIEGTSGEGSAQVRSFRPAVRALLAPLEAALLLPTTTAAAVPTPLPTTTTPEAEAATTLLAERLLDVYGQPDRSDGGNDGNGDGKSNDPNNTPNATTKTTANNHRALYNYCQALEACESALLGGFYFKHYRLATHVIGSESRGTMKRAVAALKSTYERAVFPELDACRVELGRRTDAALSGRKGRIMDGIILQIGARAGGGGDGGREAEAEGGGGSNGGGSGCPFGHGHAAAAAENAALAAGIAAAAAPDGSCPFAAAAATAAAGAAAATVKPAAAPSAAPAPPSSAPACDDDPSVAETAAALARLYAWDETSGASASSFRERTAEKAREYALSLGLAPHPRGARGLATTAAAASSASSTTPAVPLSFLDHAWGAIPPLALEQGLQDYAALAALGNPAWDAAFGAVVPEAARNVLSLLRGEGGGGEEDGSSDDNVSVQFGHNSHELVFRLLSRPMLQPRCRASSSSSGSSTPRPLRVLTSDCEFYSLARQLNALSSGADGGTPLVEVLLTVPAEPAETFEARCVEAVRAAAAGGGGRGIDAVLVSAVTFLTQRTLVRDPVAFARRVTQAAAAGEGAAGGVAEAPLVVVDAYHAFAALPLPLLPPAPAASSSPPLPAASSDASSSSSSMTIPDNLVVVAGLLKHAGSGPNAAFAALSRALARRLAPLHTGWLADPSVLAPGAPGVKVLPTASCSSSSSSSSSSSACALAYGQGSELAGATPAFLAPLLIFNRAAALRRRLGGRDGPALSPARIHARVMALHRRLIAGLEARSSSLLPRAALVPQAYADEARSHTLVFDLGSGEAARRVVVALAAHGVLVDCRSRCVRVGLGPSHDEADVDALLEAVAEASVAEAAGAAAAAAGAAAAAAAPV
jgi:tryptophan 2,3-dioxygenase